MVRQVSFQRASSSRILSSGPTRATSSTMARGTRGDGLGLPARPGRGPGSWWPRPRSPCGRRPRSGSSRPRAPMPPAYSATNGRTMSAHCSTSSPGTMKIDDATSNRSALPGSPAGREALGQAAAVEGVVLRREEQRQPAVARSRRRGRRSSGPRRRGRSGSRGAAGGSCSSAACPGRCRPAAASGTARPRTRPASPGPRSRGRSGRTRGCGRAASGTAGRTSPRPPAVRRRRGRG